MTMFLSPGGANLFASDELSRQVAIATVNGWVTLSGEDGTWVETAHFLEGVHLSAVAVDPQTGTLIAGGYFGGVWVSSDNGATWEQRTEGMDETDVWSLIAVPGPGGATRLLAGTQPANFYVSDNLGLSWDKASSFRTVDSVPAWSFPAPPHIAHVKHIVLHPLDSSRIYASVEVGTLMESRDGGESWNELTGTYEDVHRAVLHPDRPDRLIVPCGNGIYVSHDQGQTFERLTDETSEMGGYPDPMVVFPDAPDLLIAAASEATPGSWLKVPHAHSRVSRSYDAGRTWTVLTNGLPRDWQAHVAAMALETTTAESQIFLATTDGDVYRSADRGDSWQQVVHGMAAVSKENHHKTLAKR